MSHSKHESTQNSLNPICLQIRKYLEQEPLFNSQLPKDLSDDTDLIGSGVVDSLGLVTIITYLEDHFGIAIANRDLSELNFQSISAIASLVSRKQAGS